MLPTGSLLVASYSDFHLKKMVVIHPPVHPTYFNIALCTRVKEKIAREQWCHNFDLSLAPSHGACQDIFTPEIPAARNTRIVQRGTSLRACFWLVKRILACGGREGGAPAYYFFHDNLPDIAFFASWVLRSCDGGGSWGEFLWSPKITGLPEGCHATDLWSRGRELNRWEQQRRHHACSSIRIK